MSRSDAGIKVAIDGGLGTGGSADGEAVGEAGDAGSCLRIDLELSV